MNSLFIKINILILVLGLVQGCVPGQGFFTKSGVALTELNNVNSVPTSIENGVTTGSFDAASNLAQTMSADAQSAIAGASIEILPGSLAISTDMTLEEGADISSTIFDAMALDNGVANAGVAVAISNSSKSDMLVPMTLNLPLPQGSQLTATDAKLVILFQRYNATKDEMSYGVIPYKDFLVKDGIIRMFTKYFGIYQAAYVEKPVEEMAEVPTEEKLVTKREQEADPVGDPNEPALDPIVFSNLKVASFTENSVTVAWDFKSALVKSVSIKIQESVRPKSCEQPGFVRKNRDIKRHTFGSLKADTKYVIAICLVDNAGKFHDAKFQQAITFKPDVASVSLVPESNYHITVDWTALANTTGVVDYLVSYRSGDATVAPVAEPPMHCTGAQFPSESSGQFWIKGFSESETVKVRVCTRYNDGTISKGKVATVQTLQAYDICNDGTLDTICTVSANYVLNTSGTHLIAGKGSVLIDGVTITSSVNEVELVFVLGGDLICGNGTSSDCIDLTGAGYEGATNLTGGQGAGNGGGKSFASRLDAQNNTFPAGSSGGSHGGHGGRPSSSDPLSPTYGNPIFPQTFGSGGGTVVGIGSGGAGGGIVQVFAESLVFDEAYIRVDGESGDGGSGGAGGSILVDVNTISVEAETNGKLYAKGGAASSSDAGGGGGGLVAVYHQMTSLPSGFLIFVEGGSGSSPPETAGTTGPNPYIQGP